MKSIAIVAICVVSLAACVENPTTYGKSRQQFLAEQQHAERFMAEQAERTAEFKERQAKDSDRLRQINAERAEKYRQEKQRRDDLSNCELSKQFQFFSAERDVIDLVDNLDYSRRQIDQERRYAAASGVRNLYAERKNGEAIVDLNQKLRMSFDTYRSLGGKGKSPRSVRETVADPCVSLRSQND